MRSIKQLAIVAATSISLISCSKDTNDPTSKDSAVTELEKRIVGSWRYHSGEPCQADDIYIFRSDKRFTLDEGNTKCGFQFADSEWDWEITKDSVLNPVFGVPGNSSSQADLRIMRLDNDTMLLGGAEWGSQTTYIYTRKK